MCGNAKALLRFFACLSPYFVEATQFKLIELRLFHIALHVKMYGYASLLGPGLLAYLLKFIASSPAWRPACQLKLV